MYTAFIYCQCISHWILKKKKNTHNVVFLYKYCLKRWSWMVLKVNYNQTKPTKAFPIQIDALWINWGLLNCIFYKMFSTVFLLFCPQTWYLSPNLHADRHFAVQLGLWRRRRVLRPKPQRFAPCPELPASCKLQVPLHSRRITPPISLGNAPTTNVRATALRRPGWDETLCHSRRHMS